jgi:drug/metabolite transporter (DMT)-like permease
MSSAAGSPPAHRYAPVTFIFGVLAGTATAITAKILMGLQAVGADGEVAYFEKPLLITWVMFLSMALAMPLYWLKQGWDAWRSREDGLYEMQVEQLKQKRVTWRQMLALLVPTVLDLAATALCTAGLVYTTVSVSQLVRCSVLIFTALLKATVLRERLSKYMWYGLGINTIGEWTQIERPEGTGRGLTRASLSLTYSDDPDRLHQFRPWSHGGPARYPP